MTDVRPIPEGFHTLTPYLVVRGGGEAISFYEKAFGAREIYRMNGPDGSVMHAELAIGDSRLMLGDENPEMGAHSPAALGGSPVNLFLYVEDVDASFRRAIDAGCESLAAPEDMFWGDRYSKLRDPYGHSWSIATHIEDVSPEEMGRRARKLFAPADD